LIGDAEIVSEISADFVRLQRNRKAFEKRFEALEKARGKKERHKAAWTLAVKNPETGSIGLLLSMSAEDQMDMISIMIDDTDHKKFIKSLLERIKIRRIFKAVSYVMPVSFGQAPDNYKKKRNYKKKKNNIIIIVIIVVFIISGISVFMKYNKEYSGNKKYSGPLRSNYTNMFYKVLITEGNSKTEMAYKDRELKIKIPEHKEIKAGSLFYVYDYYPHLSEKPQNPATKSLLIGLTSDINQYATKKEEPIIGWIDRTEVTFWNTRIGCEFTVGSRVELITDKGKITLKGNKRPVSYNSLRNPVLAKQGDYYKIGIFKYGSSDKTPLQYIDGLVHKDTKLNMYVLVSKTDIESMISFLSKFITSENINNRKRIWEHLLKIVIGEDACRYPDGTGMSPEDCNKMQTGVPVKAGFIKYTKNEFLNLKYHQKKEVRCQAKILKEKLRLVSDDKKPDKVVFLNRKNCDFKIEYTLDINGDGLVVKDGNVYTEVPGSKKLKLIRKAKHSDLIDKYFFKERGESVAWIPLEHLGDIEEE
jgi:hypothetical protein